MTRLYCYIFLRGRCTKDGGRVDLKGFRGEQWKEVWVDLSGGIDASPLSKDILVVMLLKKFLVPQIPPYDGKFDLQDHVIKHTNSFLSCDASNDV